MQGIDPNFAVDAMDGVDDRVDPDRVVDDEQILAHDGANFCS